MTCPNLTYQKCEHNLVLSTVKPVLSIFLVLMQLKNHTIFKNNKNTRQFLKFLSYFACQKKRLLINYYTPHLFLLLLFIILQVFFFAIHCKKHAKCTVLNGSPRVSLLVQAGWQAGIQSGSQASIFCVRNAKKLKKNKYRVYVVCQCLCAFFFYIITLCFCPGIGTVFTHFVAGVVAAVFVFLSHSLYKSVLFFFVCITLL